MKNESFFMILPQKLLCFNGDSSSMIMHYLRFFSVVSYPRMVGIAKAFFILSVSPTNSLTSNFALEFVVNDNGVKKHLQNYV